MEILNPVLDQFIKTSSEEFQLIPPDRKAILDDLALLLIEKRGANNKVNVLFVCTHNSRRSQIAQVLFNLAMRHLNVNHIDAYSCGTEVTAMHHHAIEALSKIGLSIKNPRRKTDNPKYSVQIGKSKVMLYSKRYDDDSIPDSDNTAIMVCSDAEQNCPFIPGVSQRIGLPYDDPKVFDQDKDAVDYYYQTVKNIGREMFYLAKALKQPQF